jgi:hypothetical protein
MRRHPMCTRRALVVVVLVAAPAATAGAATARLRTTASVCDGVLSRREAATVMDEFSAVRGLEKTFGSTLYCSYLGFEKTPSGPKRSVAVKLGPYSDFRMRASEDGKTVTCSVSGTACKTLKMSLKAKPNQASFALFAKASDQVGTARRLPASLFGGNPAFAWVPSEAWIKASSLGATTWVFVYLAGPQKLMTVLCGELDGVPADVCAVRAADRAFANITS